MNLKSFEKTIDEAWNKKDRVNAKSSKELLNSINKTIDLLDNGKIRVAEKKGVAVFFIRQNGKSVNSSEWSKIYP